MAISQILNTAAGIIRPPPDRNAWQWADQCRVLPPESAEPGKWRTSRVPYMYKPYEAASDPACNQITLVCGAQMSKTEFELNILGHRFDDGPYVPALYVGPTQKQVSGMSRDRVHKMVREVPRLFDKLAKGQDDKIAEKWFGGVRLGFAWAGSPTELASWPAGLCVVDERDRMDNDVGGEGDPVELVRARGSTYSNRLMVVVSTPTVYGASPIMGLFHNSTMEIWGWYCPHCGEWFRPHLDLLEFPNSDDFNEVREGAFVICPHCGAGCFEEHKRAMNEAGEYFRHTFDGENYSLDHEPKPNPSYGFWVSGLASPWVTFGERAEAILKANKTNNQKVIQGVVNTAFGEPFRIQGEAPDFGEILALKNEMPSGAVPWDHKWITAGCDVQKNGIYYVIRSWGFNDVSHLIEHGFIHGETEYDDVWILWQQIISREFEGRYIDRVFVDSGYNPVTDRWRRPDHKVYQACRRTNRLAFPSKGHDTQDRPTKAAKLDLNRHGKTYAGSIILWHIDTDHFKSWLRAQTDLPDDVEPKFSLNADTDDDYCKQMIAEELIVDDKGKRKWVTPGAKDNHYFDCEVLARAAATTIQADKLKPRGNDPRPPEEIQKNQQPRRPEPKDPRLQRRAGSFQRR